MPEIKDILPLILEELLEAGNNLSTEKGPPPNIQVDFTNPANIKNIDQFCKDHGYSHSAISLVAGVQDNKGKMPYDTVIYDSSHKTLAHLLLTHDKKHIMAAEIIPEYKDKMLKDITETQMLNEMARAISDVDFVSRLRSDQTIAINDKYKLMHFKAASEFIDSKFNDAAKNNIVIVGEYHHVMTTVFMEQEVRHYLSEKHGVKKLGTENYIENPSSLGGTSSGIMFGSERSKDLNQNHFYLDIPNHPYAKTDQGFLERETYFIKQIKTNCHNENALCVMGGMHVIIAEQLKKDGFNPILLEVTSESHANSPLKLKRQEYLHENSYQLGINASFTVEVSKLTYDEALKEADRVVDLYLSLEEKYDQPKLQHKKSPQRQIVNH